MYEEVVFCWPVVGFVLVWEGNRTAGTVGFECTYVRVAFGRFNLWDCFELCCIYTVYALMKNA